MEDRKDIAAEKKRKGTHNCAQAVLDTYADVVGADPALLMRLGRGFAAGMGNGDGTCGAIVGAGMIIGLATESRPASVKAMGALMQKFAARCGSTKCSELKGIATGCPLRSCPDCVSDASELLEEALSQLDTPAKL
jgi:C_GCAxxG_C_C family probable redox protein